MTIHFDPQAGPIDSSQAPHSKVSDWATTFDHALDREMLRTECRRTSTTAGFLLMLLAVVLGVSAAPQVVAPGLRERFLQMTWPLSALLTAYGVLEVLMRLGMGRLLRAGNRLPATIRYLQVVGKLKGQAKPTRLFKLA